MSAAAIVIGARVTVEFGKFNARSKDPITGHATGTKPFALVKAKTVGTVEAFTPDGDAVIKFDGVTTRQAMRPADLLAT
jgi:hypothetical protein